MILVANAAALAALWPRGEDQLVIYSMMGPARALTAAFTARTGIPVTYINLEGGPMQARLYAEGDHPRWTVAWFTGEAPMAALDATGLLARHAPDDPEWPDAPFTDLARSLLPADRAWLPTRIGLGAAFVAAAGAPAPGRSWQDAFLQARAPGLLSPVSSGGAYPVLATILAVATGSGRSLLLGSRSRLRIFPSSSLLFEALRSGDVSFAILPSETAFNLRRRDRRLSVTLPVPNTVLPDVIGVSPHASPTDRKLAAQFIRFVLSAPGQALLGRDTAAALGWPPVTNAVPNPTLPTLPVDLVHLPAGLWGARQDEEIGWFEREVVR